MLDEQIKSFQNKLIEKQYSNVTLIKESFKNMLKNFNTLK